MADPKVRMRVIVDERGEHFLNRADLLDALHVARFEAVAHWLADATRPDHNDGDVATNPGPTSSKLVVGPDQFDGEACE